MDTNIEEVILNKYKDKNGNKFYNNYKVLGKYGEGSVGKV